MRKLREIVENELWLKYLQKLLVEIFKHLGSFLFKFLKAVNFFMGFFLLKLLDSGNFMNFIY